jgi:hypothetical protein
MTQPSDDNRRQQRPADRGGQISHQLRSTWSFAGTGNDLSLFAWNLQVPFDRPEFGLISLKG